MRSLKFIVLFSVFLSFSLLAQDEKSGAADASANANNPLADLKAFNIQFNYQTGLTGVDGMNMVTSFRYAQPVGKILFRATLPTLTVNRPSDNSSVTGLGDFNLFATYLATSSSSPVQFGVGPMVFAPTSTAVSTVSGPGGSLVNNYDVSLGANNWQVGGALVLFIAKSKMFQWGGLVTWTVGVGEDSKLTDNQGNALDADENLAAIQPFYFFQLGKGNYLRGAPIWTMDFTNSKYNFPIGIGYGKVLKLGSTVFNLFIEPQYAVYSQGVGQSSFQIFSSINMQFYGGKK
ncbi:hypothetical protein [Flammeovirga agarivorans]|uniref:MetA-pathway of phenol degradation n=1 Tax=Flammeovirga agarivorans TaxID=2726742 RepID=A0A7X8SHU6_9BACT|nr:hypothetical protein [Flammeovirga agarivorans]NLR90525.1 hypothetical protein [Flammeovirga agarivorans]